MRQKRKEAIKRLKEFKILHTEQAGWDVTTQEALGMAIEVLEQESCSSAISREDLIQKFYDDVFIRDKTDSKEDYQQVFASTVLAVIEHMPPVTPQEPILDKVRDEIDSAKMPKNRMSFFRDGIDCALQIIDKYRGESEEV